MDSLLAYSPIVEYLSTNNAKKTLRFSSPSTSSSLCITDLDPCREGKEKERKEKKKKRRNKFSAMKDSLFLLRSNVVSGRERLEREEGERGSTISSFITSPPDKSVHFAVPHRVRTVHKQHTASLGCGYLRMYRVCIISVDV